LENKYLGVLTGLSLYLFWQEMPKKDAATVLNALAYGTKKEELVKDSCLLHINFLLRSTLFLAINSNRLLALLEHPIF